MPATANSGGGTEWRRSRVKMAAGKRDGGGGTRGLRSPGSRPQSSRYLVTKETKRMADTSVKEGRKQNRAWRETLNCLEEMRAGSWITKTPSRSKNGPRGYPRKGGSAENSINREREDPPDEGGTWPGA